MGRNALQRQPVRIKWTQRKPDRRKSGWFLAELVNPPNKDAEKDYTEQRQQEFAKPASELHSERHSLVFNEINLEPVTKDVKMLAKAHIGLDEYFDDLVYHYKSNAQHNEPLALRHFQIHTESLLLFLVEHLLRLDGESCVRNKTESLLRDEFAGHAAYSVGLVLDAHESRLKVLNELVQALSELYRLFQYIKNYLFELLQFLITVTDLYFRLIDFLFFCHNI